MDDLRLRTQEWRESHPLKQWRRSQGYSIRQAGIVLDMLETRILHLEVGEPPAEDEMATIAQRTGITKDSWTAWERVLPRDRQTQSQG
ncbi:MAG TPA: hypothetical protein VJT32_13985 [bacterium]|nr:hypothetical protein [bacterium]